LIICIIVFSPLIFDLPYDTILAKKTHRRKDEMYLKQKTAFSAVFYTTNDGYLKIKNTDEVVFCFIR